ncbi:MAG: hypothetical protein R3353_03455 [Salegentibacter mishustinae]|nr:hypothetical protein [Salegentibacter mishustinae]
MEEKDLNPNITDHIISGLKLGSNFIPIPGVGSVLSEIVGNIIPNQRIDRIAEYVQILNSKIESISSEIVQKELQNEQFIDLIEEGFIQASRTISKERKEYIAEIIKNGLSLEEIDFIQSKHILKILSELNDIEVIWLRYYLRSQADYENNFRENNKEILSPFPVSKETMAIDWNKSAIQDSYKDHLLRLKLVERKIKVNRKTKTPEYDNSGNIITETTRITQLGRLLLQQIGLNP